MSYLVCHWSHDSSALYLHVYTCIHMHTCVCMHIYIYIYVHVFIEVHTPCFFSATPPSTYTPAHTDTNMGMCMFRIHSWGALALPPLPQSPYRSLGGHVILYRGYTAGVPYVGAMSFWFTTNFDPGSHATVHQKRGLVGTRLEAVILGRHVHKKNPHKHAMEARVSS